MDITRETSGWDQLHNRYYRKKEVYTMHWGTDVDLAKMRCAGSRQGGPLAMSRDQQKLVKLDHATAAGSGGPDEIHVFSSSGRHLSTFTHRKSSASMLSLGWNAAEHVVVVLSDGIVLVYSVFGELLNEFSLGRECKEDGGLLDAHVHDVGVVGLTGKLRFVACSGFTEPRLRVLGDPQLDAPPKSWAVVDARHTASMLAEVLVATASGTVLLVDGDGAQDMLVSNGPFTRMALSDDGKCVACFTREGRLWVVTADFRNEIASFDTKSRVPPEQLVWCGVDSVVMYWDKIVLMVGPEGEWVKYSYDAPLYMVAECDGIRIVSNDTCEFLQRVPDATEEIFLIGSTAPSAMLFDAADHFARGSPKADEIIRAIKPDLADAVDRCMEAASHEPSITMQRGLLRAAAFGKSFLEFYDAERFVKMCRVLRVLNNVRDHEVGVAMTYEQYDRVGAAELVQRLVQRHLHLLALRVCEYLKLRTDVVLVHWACAKVKSSASDADVRRQVVAKLGESAGISYAEIASTAYARGRPELATMLLEHEPRAADQVPLLISMGKDELALLKAIESGDTDLVYLVVLHIKRHKPQQFFAIIHDKPVAMELLIKYCKAQDRALLKSMYSSADRHGEIGNILVLEAYATDNFDRQCRLLQDALDEYRQAKECAFAARATEEQLKLLMTQKNLSSEIPDIEFVGLALGDTLYHVVRAGQYKRAAKLAKDFKVPDKRLWWIRVNAVSSIKDWAQLERIAKEKKSPIGYEPFARACIEHGEHGEAAKYVSRVAEPDVRVDLFCRLRQWKDAALCAARDAKDPQLLVRVRAQFADDPSAVQFIEQLLAQMQ